MAELKVVQMRTAPLLSDIPGQLRAFADRIERGDTGPYETMVCCAWGDESFTPDGFIWGHNGDRHRAAGMLFHMAHLTLINKDSSDAT